MNKFISNFVIISCSLALLVQGSFSHAKLTKERCTDIRLDIEGSSMHKIPIRNQSGQTCYSHAAVDLIDAKMGFNSDPSSPIDAAAHFKATTPSSFFEAAAALFQGSSLYEDFLINRVRGGSHLDYGITKNLLDYLIENGTCPESKVISDAALENEFEGSNGIKLGRYQQKLKEFWDKYHSSMIHTDEEDRVKVEEVIKFLKDTETTIQGMAGVDLEDELGKQYKKGKIDYFEWNDKRKLNKSCMVTPKKDVTVLFNDIDKIFKALRQKELRHFYAEIFSVSCKERRQVPKSIKAIQTYIRSENDFENRLALAFDRSPEPKQPFAVTFGTQRVLPGGFPTELSFHTAVLIGRRFNIDKNRCEVLIKDSMGSDPFYYAEGAQHRADHGDEGKMWFSVEDLASRTIRTTHLE